MLYKTFRNFFKAKIIFAFCLQGYVFASTLVLQNLDYKDAMQTLKNYDRGFYFSQGLHIKKSGTSPINEPYGKLLHLRADIAEFSSNAWISIEKTNELQDTIWGNSQDLTEDALNVIQTSFDNIRKFGGKVIIRFCYDPWFDGHSNTTPEHKWVLRHIEQLAPILSKNVDIIVALEMGMHGAFGEMHSDTSITYPRVAEAVNYMLRLTPPELKILTRTGDYSAAVLGFENRGVDFNIHSDVFKQIAKEKGDTMYRVGMFNDGYLGTQYDYGTWGSDCKTSICREEGVEWLEKYSINTPYGGEAVATPSGYEVINTPDFLSYEGFRTHTSYLNIHWNPDVIKNWKDSHFTKKDLEYDGFTIDSLTGFKYIEDHLGYRFVLRESWLPDTLYANEKLQIKLKVQNVGFGNLTRNVPTYLLLRNAKQNLESENSFFEEIPLNSVNFMNVYSRTIMVNETDTVTTFDGTNEISFDVINFKNTQWDSCDVFLKVGDVFFANPPFNNNQIESNLPNNAIYLGRFVLTQKPKPNKILPYSANFYNNHLENINPYVERKRNSIQIHGGSLLNEKIYNVNGKKLN